MSKKRQAPVNPHAQAVNTPSPTNRPKQAGSLRDTRRNHVTYRLLHILMTSRSTKTTVKETYTVRIPCDDPLLASADIWKAMQAHDVWIVEQDGRQYYQIKIFTVDPPKLNRGRKMLINRLRRFAEIHGL